jgi:catechol 2,3-dioxygenase-like lactoylglutathione lyase family enzyme
MQQVVRRLAAVDVAVPSPAEAATFLASMLDFERHGDDGAEHLTTEGEYGVEPPARVISLVPGPELGVAGLTFDVGSEPGLAALRDRLDRLGVAHEPLDDGAGGPGTRMVAPGGVPVTCRLPAPPFAGALAPSDVRPRRLGHVNLKVPDPAAASSFFCDALGLRLTEQVGEMLFFLRVNADHHNLAFRAAPSANVHHVAFEVPGWDSLRVVCDHLAARGHVIEYGPGRHAPGHQLFLYLREPSSGLRLELFTDMAHIDDEDGFRPIRRDIDRMRSVNVWGPAPPASFLE